MKHKVIFFIGFMGTGKTTFGIELAKKLNYKFIDADQQIELSLTKSIKEIFEDEGEAAFRAYESEWLKNLKINTNTIIALGGGMPCFNNNMERINQLGVSVYLKTDVEVLAERLIKSETIRPIIESVKNNKEKLIQAITTILAEREPFYTNATYSLSSESVNCAEVIELLELQVD